MWFFILISKYLMFPQVWALVSVLVWFVCLLCWCYFVWLFGLVCGCFCTHISSAKLTHYNKTWTTGCLAKCLTPTFFQNHPNTEMVVFISLKIFQSWRFVYLHAQIRITLTHLNYLVSPDLLQRHDPAFVFPEELLPGSYHDQHAKTFRI